MIYGYCRISTPTQSITRQERNILAAFPAAKLFSEAFTGRKIDRPEWNKLRKAVKSGDTIVFDSVSRMSRDAADGVQVYEELEAQGVELVFLKEPHINTATYKNAAEDVVPMTGSSVDIILTAVNQYLKTLAREQIRLAFEQSEKEVTDLHQRTKEGMETAKANGKQVGRKTGQKVTTKKSTQAKEVIRAHYKQYGGSLKADECIRLAGCSRNSFFKYCREIDAESLTGGAA